MSPIYLPAEDSFLMSRNLKKEIPKAIKENTNIRFLEIGCGSGINLETAKKSGIKNKNIFAADINPEAVKHCKLLGFNCIKSDLFEKIPKQKFDLIIFNPPYLPKNYEEPKNSRLATTGGQGGEEISIDFLKQARDFLSSNGKILLITSSQAKQINFKKLKYKSKILDEEKLFFEKLTLWEITF